MLYANELRRVFAIAQSFIEDGQNTASDRGAAWVGKTSQFNERWGTFFHFNFFYLAFENFSSNWYCSRVFFFLQLFLEKENCEEKKVKLHPVCLVRGRSLVGIRKKIAVRHQNARLDNLALTFWFLILSYVLESVVLAFIIFLFSFLLLRASFEV